MDKVELTVYREKVEDIILPPSALTAEVQEIFHPNNSSLESVHGPVGSANLVLLVPKGKRVTIIRGQVRAYGLQGSIGFIASTCEEVADIEGDVELFDSTLETARNIRGKLYQRYYRYLGVKWESGEASGTRHAAENCRLEDIRGGMDIDVSNVQIKAARLGGGCESTTALAKHSYARINSPRTAASSWNRAPAISAYRSKRPCWTRFCWTRSI